MNIIPIVKASRNWNQKIGCLVATPSDYDRSISLPLIIMLHGTGEGGSNLNDLKLAGIMKEVAAGREVQAIILAPQFPTDNDWWNEVAIDWIYTLVLDPNFKKDFNIDLNKVTATGYSAGSRGVEMLAQRHPDLLAGGSVVAVRNYDFTKLASAKDIPFWMLSNKGDGSDWSSFQNAFSKAGGKLKTTTIDGQSTLWESLTHDAWTRAYNIDELYSWHVSQSKAMSQPIPDPTPTSVTPTDITAQVNAKLKELTDLLAGAKITK